jgi:DNA-binding transcriptional MerR regulator
VTWSTSELANLAGTTVKAVRHYHAVGLLEAPDRRYNGDKQYRVRHLVRLIRVRRLVELGVPLSEVESSDGDGVTILGGLRQIDAKVGADIERLRRTRSDIAAILRDDAPADTPRGFESVALRLSEADRALIQICTRLYDKDALASLHAMVAAETDAVSEAFNTVSSSADEAARQRVAERIGDGNWRSAGPPWAGSQVGHLRKSEYFTRRTIAEALVELYNPAQRDVLTRASRSERESEREQPRDRHPSGDDRVILEQPLKCA